MQGKGPWKIRDRLDDLADRYESNCTKTSTRNTNAPRMESPFFQFHSKYLLFRLQEWLEPFFPEGLTHSLTHSILRSGLEVNESATRCLILFIGPKKIHQKKVRTNNGRTIILFRGLDTYPHHIRIWGLSEIRFLKTLVESVLRKSKKVNAKNTFETSFPKRLVSSCEILANLEIHCWCD